MGKLDSNMYVNEGEESFIEINILTMFSDPSILFRVQHMSLRPIRFDSNYSSVVVLTFLPRYYLQEV